MIKSDKVSFASPRCTILYSKPKKVKGRKFSDDAAFSDKGYFRGRVTIVSRPPFGAVALKRPLIFLLVVFVFARSSVGAGRPFTGVQGDATVDTVVRGRAFTGVIAKCGSL